MPELPEVETARRGLAPFMEGARLTRLELRRADLRFPFPQGMAQSVENRQIIAIGRRAKYLLIELEGNLSVLAHLGMSGSFRIEGAPKKGALGDFHHPRSKTSLHDHVVFHLDGGPLRIVYNDPRRFGFMDLAASSQLNSHPFLAELGPEPTGNLLSADVLAQRFRNKSQSLKSALLDQKNIAGLGNIYVCEALYRARLSPRRVASSLVTPEGLPTDDLFALVGHIRDVIGDGIAAGGASLRDHIQTDGSRGYFQHDFQVYGRKGQPCRSPHCSSHIERITQAGRSTFLCPCCQP